MPRKTYDAVIRVSRRNNRSGDSFISPKVQRQVIDQWAEANDVAVARYHDETDSVSGKTVDRVGLKAALARAKSGEVDGIVVAKVDRFARTLIGGLTAVRELDDAGRDFIAVQDGLTGGVEESRSPTARFLRGMLFLMAAWQLDSLTLSWETARDNHIMRGVHGVERFGYRKSNGTGSKLLPDEREARYVREVFERRARGTSWTEIADWLNAEGVKPRRGQRWTHARIGQIVESTTYLGEARSGEFVNPVAHEPIVTLDLWQRANACRSTKDRRASGEYLLRGLARCASCGAKLRGQLDGDHRYYRCRRRFSYGTCPEPTGALASDLEAYVEAVFLARFVEIEMEGDQANDELDGALRDLEDAKAELRRYRDDETVRTALEAVDEGLWTEGMVQRAEVVSRAQVRVSTARAQATGLLVPEDLAATWPNLSVEMRRKLLAEGFDAVAVKSRRGRHHSRAPITERVKLFGRGEAPPDLPGRGGGSSIRPINF